MAVRGEDRIAILDVELAIKQAGGIETKAIRRFIDTINSPAQVWFNAKGTLAFVASQKVSKLDVLKVNQGKGGYSNPQRLVAIDISQQDKAGFTPFLKTSPDGKSYGFRTNCQMRFPHALQPNPLTY